MEENSYRFCYLSLITDAYSKEIVGWCVGETLETENAMKALDMALSRIEGQSCKDLIHHSDRGVQYASFAYVEKLLSRDIQISMTESGDPKDNAVAERINGIIKNELLKDIAFFSIEEVRTTVEKAIDFYNNERPHMSLDWLTPSEAAKMEGPIEKKWHTATEKPTSKTCTFRKEPLSLRGKTFPGLARRHSQGRSGLRPKARFRPACRQGKAGLTHTSKVLPGLRREVVNSL